MKRLLLLSGGIDSAALAAWIRPEQCLHVNYGQRPAVAEARAARQIAVDLGLSFDEVVVPAAAIGAGLMTEGAERATLPDVAPEWWPYRNQLLITIAAAWGVCRGFGAVLIGTVAADGARHADGGPEFRTHMDALLALQEGGMRLHAPASHLSAPELISESKISDVVLGWTHSCHRANLPCANCPGCLKHIETLYVAGRLQ